MYFYMAYENNYENLIEILNFICMDLIKTIYIYKYFMM